MYNEEMQANYIATILESPEEFDVRKAPKTGEEIEGKGTKEFEEVRR